MIRDILKNRSVEQQIFIQGFTYIGIKGMNRTGSVIMLVLSRIQKPIRERIFAH